MPLSPKVANTAVRTSISTSVLAGPAARLPGPLPDGADLGGEQIGDVTGGGHAVELGGETPGRLPRCGGV